LSLYVISRVFLVPFSGILCIGTTMEMRRHFGAKAKEKGSKDDFGFRIQRECRSTPVSAQ